jgi:hypothetical protein
MEAADSSEILMASIKEYGINIINFFYFLLQVCSLYSDINIQHEYGRPVIGRTESFIEQVGLAVTL